MGGTPPQRGVLSFCYTPLRILALFSQLLDKAMIRLVMGFRADGSRGGGVFKDMASARSGRYYRRSGGGVDRYWARRALYRAGGRYYEARKADPVDRERQRLRQRVRRASR